MKPLLALGLLLAAAGPAPCLPPGSAPQVAARTMLSQDGTRTDSVKDLLKHELTETVYDARGVVIAKKKFLLGENGDPTQGAIYDGADNVLARVQFFFDDLGRVTEERCTNTQGEVFQRVIRQYDASGNPLQPLVINLPVKAASMRPARIDFTRSPAPPLRGTKSKTPAPGTALVAPAQGPKVETVSPGTGAVISTDSDPARPPNLQIPQTTEPPKEEPKKRSKLNPLNWFKKEKQP